jgi:hypothetical protein
MATLNLNQIANATLTALNVAATQDRIVFGNATGLRMSPATLSQGRLPSPSSHEHDPSGRPAMYAKAYVVKAAKRAGRLASFSGTLAGFGRLARPLSTGWRGWRSGTTTTAFGLRVREVEVVGRAGSDPVTVRRQAGGHDCLSHGRRGATSDADYCGPNAMPALGTAPTATRGK